MLGGSDVTGDTLLRFYVLHIYLLPALLVLGLGIHIWRVRKDGFAIDDREDDDAPPERSVPKEEVTVDA
jgi:cytochrome b-561